MQPAGDDGHFEQRASAARFERLPVRDRGLAGAAAAVGDGHLHVAASHLFQRNVDGSFAAQRLALDDGQVPLAYGARLELGADGVIGAGIEGDDDGAARIAVEAVQQAVVARLAQLGIDRLELLLRLQRAVLHVASVWRWKRRH